MIYHVNKLEVPLTWIETFEHLRLPYFNPSLRWPTGRSNDGSRPSSLLEGERFNKLNGRPQQRAIGTWVFWKHWDGVGLDVVNCKNCWTMFEPPIWPFFGGDPLITNLSNPHQRGPAKLRTWGANMLDHVGICLPLSEMRNFHLAKNPKTPPTPTKFDYLTLDLQSCPEIRAS